MSVNWVEGRRALLKVNGTWESAIACYDDANQPQRCWVPLVSGDDEGVPDSEAVTAPDPEACPMCGAIGECDAWCHASHIVESERAAVVMADYGDWVWAPDGLTGFMPASFLRIIADELDRRTESEDG